MSKLKTLLCAAVLTVVLASPPSVYACKMTPLGGTLQALKAIVEMYRGFDIDNQRRSNQLIAIYYDRKNNWWVTEERRMPDGDCVANAWRVTGSSDCSVKVDGVLGAAAIACKTN